MAMGRHLPPEEKFCLQVCLVCVCVLLCTCECVCERVRVWKVICVLENSLLSTCFMSTLSAAVASLLYHTHKQTQTNTNKHKKTHTHTTTQIHTCKHTELGLFLLSSWIHRACRTRFRGVCVGGWGGRGEFHVLVSLSVCLSICLSVCLSICLSVCLSVYLAVGQSVCEHGGRVRHACVTHMCVTPPFFPAIFPTLSATHTYEQRETEGTWQEGWRGEKN